MPYPHVIQFETRKQEIEERLRLIEIRQRHECAAWLARRTRRAARRSAPVTALWRVLRFGLISRLVAAARIER